MWSGVVVRVSLLVCSISMLDSKMVHTQEAGDIVTGRGFAAPPEHYSQLSGHGTDKNQKSRPASHIPRNIQVVGRVSEFNQPNSFQPRPAKYPADFHDQVTTEQVLVDGPPLGDHVLEQYQKYIEMLELASKPQFQGLNDNIFKQTRTRRKEATSTAVEKPNSGSRQPSVNLDYVSVQEDYNNFIPNEGWKGNKERGLLKVPYEYERNQGRKQVKLDFVSSSPSGNNDFQPNGRWFGNKETDLLEPPRNIRPHRRQPKLLNTSPPLTKLSSFHPSSWQNERETYQEHIREDELNEPVVITIDNVHKFLGSQRPDQRPDTFSVNVKSVLRTRGAASQL